MAHIHSVTSNAAYKYSLLGSLEFGNGSFFADSRSRSVFSEMMNTSLVRNFEKGIRKNNSGNVVVRYHLYKLNPARPDGQYLFKITSNGNKKRTSKGMKEDYAFVYGAYVVCYKNGVCSYRPEYEMAGSPSDKVAETKKVL